jgi:hypothetical protein
VKAQPPPASIGAFAEAEACPLKAPQRCGPGGRAAIQASHPLPGGPEFEGRGRSVSPHGRIRRACFSADTPFNLRRAIGLGTDLFFIHVDANDYFISVCVRPLEMSRSCINPITHTIQRVLVDGCWSIWNRKNHAIFSDVQPTLRTFVGIHWK